MGRQSPSRDIPHWGTRRSLESLRTDGWRATYFVVTAPRFPSRTLTVYVAFSVSCLAVQSLMPGAGCNRHRDVPAFVSILTQVVVPFFGDIAGVINVPCEPIVR